MTTLGLGGGRSLSIAILISVGLGATAAPSAAGPDDAPAPASNRQKPDRMAKLLPNRKADCRGTLGYGPPGIQPGFQGFGLGFHRGYGFGGAALGVGAEGGYPLYGGPGYPHPAPQLRRIGGIVPFEFFGGPGGPGPGQSNFFGTVGPLEPDKPVVTFNVDSPETGFDGGYGCLTGTLPYPEQTFAEFSSGDTGRKEGRDGVGPSMSGGPDPADAGTSLGIESEPTVDAGLARGLKVTRLQPGGAGEKAGLQVGDVIRAANGYLTEQPGNLTWIVANASPDNNIKFTILAAKDGEVRTITARRP